MIDDIGFSKGTNINLYNDMMDITNVDYLVDPNATAVELITGYTITGTTSTGFSSEFLRKEWVKRFIKILGDKQSMDGWFNPRKINITKKPKLHYVNITIRNQLPIRIRINE